jgi:RND family efflux transporter MFP subunit
MTRYVPSVLLRAAAPIALASCAGSDAQEMQPAEPVPVTTAQVVQEEVTRPIVATGTLGAKDEIVLSFKTGGVVAHIAVDAGDAVRAGQVLAALDVREIDAAVARAESAGRKAERDLARARRLYVDSVVTRAQLEDAETAAELARADLEGAAFNRRYAVIAAPAAGVVLRREAQSGETVAPGAAVLVFGSDARGSVVRVGLADRDRVRVRTGDPATVIFDALPGRTFNGRVADIGAAAAHGTGTYSAEIAIRDGQGLPSGLIGTVEIRPAAGVASLIPIEALLEADGERAVVFALSADGGHAERREVIVGFLHGDRVVVAAGLEGVRSVVTDGAAYLNDGASVRVVR